MFRFVRMMKKMLDYGKQQIQNHVRIETAIHLFVYRSTTTSSGDENM